MEELAYGLAEQVRQLNSVALKGTVEQTDYAMARVRVRSGDTLTGWIPWMTSRAGGDVDWSAPEIGEQVMVLCPSGDPANGVVLGAIYQTAHPANANKETIRRTTFDDGAVIEYDRENHALKVILPDNASVALSSSGGTMAVDLQGGITIKGDVTLEGDINQTGKITSSGDHVAGSISLQQHVHGGVQSGSGTTGAPT